MAVAVTLAALGGAATGCQRHEHGQPTRHHATGAGAGAHANMLAPDGHAVLPIATDFMIDGEWNEPAWNELAISGAFVGDDGNAARPVSQIRLLADPAHAQILVGLYAADEDLRSTDHFDLAIGSLAIQIDPRGTITPPIAGIRAAVDTDGTIDQPRDDDEEWVIEIAIPIAALGPNADPAHELPVRTSRCDVTKDHVTRCGHWQATIRLPAQPQPPS